MTAIRSLLFNGFFFGSMVLVLLWMRIWLPLPRRIMQGTARAWTRWNRLALRWIVGLHLEVRGLERVPPGPVILASKHQSAWDTIVFFLFFDDVRYVVKRELLSIPLWGWYAWKCGSIAVDRSGGTAVLRKLVRETKSALADGAKVVIFPEGTRSAPGTHRPYLPGVASLYRATDVPVVPVALNSGVFWGRRSFTKRPGTMVIEFLPPTPKGLDRKAFLAELERRIETVSDGLVPASYRSRPAPSE